SDIVLGINVGIGHFDAGGFVKSFPNRGRFEIRMVETKGERTVESVKVEQRPATARIDKMRTPAALQINNDLEPIHQQVLAKRRKAKVQKVIAHINTYAGKNFVSNFTAAWRKTPPM